jgi:translocation and assembly module TamB
MRPLLKGCAIAITLAVAAALTAAWWATSSPTALQWLVREVVQRSQGTLTLEGVSGSLLDRVTVRRLRYAAEDVSATLDEVALTLSFNDLLQRRLKIVGIEASLVDIQSADSATGLKPPRTLALPLDIDSSGVRIRRVQYKGLTFANVAFGYRGSNTQHVVNDLSVDTGWGHLSGDLRIDAQAPFGLSGQVALDQPREYKIEVALKGTLQDIDIKAHGVSRDAVIDATARLKPFDPLWLPEVSAHGENINLAAFAPELPASSISFDLTGVVGSMPWAAGTVTLRNATAGTISAKRLPLIKLTADFTLQDPTTAVLSNLVGDLGTGGTVTGSARISPGGGSVDLKVRELDLHTFHTALHTTRLTGALQATTTGDAQTIGGDVVERGVRIRFKGTRRGDTVAFQEVYAQSGDATLSGRGEINLLGLKQFQAEARFNRLNPATLGRYPAANLSGTLRVTGDLSPEWRVNTLLALRDSEFQGLRITGNATGTLTAQAAQQFNVNINAGVNTLRASGSYGRPGDRLTVTVVAPRLSQLHNGIAGAIVATGNLTGDVRHPQFTADITATNIVLENKMRAGSVRMHAEGTLAKHALALSARGQDFDVEAHAEGAWQAPLGWTGVLTSFRNSGIYPAQLLTPMPITFTRGGYSAGPARAMISGGNVTLTNLEWRDGRLGSSGEIRDLPAVPLLALARITLPQSSLRINGAWSITTSPSLNGWVTLARATGDIMTPGQKPVALGLERLSVDARFVNGAIDASIDLLAQTINGTARLTTPSMLRTATLKLDGKFDIASLRVLDPLLGNQVFLRGKAAVMVSGRGTLEAPQFSGSVAAVNLSLEAPQYGVRLRDGTLQADIDDNTVTLREFAFRGDDGSLSATGSMPRVAGGTAQLAWRVQHLRVLNRPDMRLKLDGSGTAALAQKKLVVRGSLIADEGHFELDTPKAPRLADDIVVLGRPRQQSQSAVPVSFQTTLLDLDLALDAGEHMHVIGAGVNTDLRGKVNLKTNARGVLEARGVLNSIRGEYFAFGQRLAIDRGRLIFDGPIDNPALDIVATRRNLAVAAGVEVTGNVRVPNVRLISDPPVSDSEKLAWLTLGHGLQDATGADLALLQAAASALIGRGSTIPVTQRIARQLGLDELSLKGGGQASGQVVAFGKRLSDKLYVEYQQGLAATSTVLRFSYALTRSLSVRLETGLTNSLGFYFTRSYD